MKWTFDNLVSWNRVHGQTTCLIVSRGRPRLKWMPSNRLLAVFARIIFLKLTNLLAWPTLKSPTPPIGLQLSLYCRRNVSRSWKPYRKISVQNPKFRSKFIQISIFFLKSPEFNFKNMVWGTPTTQPFRLLPCRVAYLYASRRSHVRLKKFQSSIFKILTPKSQKSCQNSRFSLKFHPKIDFKFFFYRKSFRFRLAACHECWSAKFLRRRRRSWFSAHLASKEILISKIRAAFLALWTNPPIVRCLPTATL